MSDSPIVGFNWYGGLDPDDQHFVRIEGFNIDRMIIVAGRLVTRQWRYNPLSWSWDQFVQNYGSRGAPKFGCTCSYGSWHDRCRCGCGDEGGSAWCEYVGCCGVEVGR